MEHELTPLQLLEYYKQEENNEEIEGDGIIDGIAYRVKNIGKPRTNLQPSARKVLEQYGNQKVSSAFVCRKPLGTALQTIVKGLASNLPHDKLFHLSIRFKLSIGVTVLMEKNSVINIQVFNPPAKRTECRDVTKAQGLTLNGVIEKTKAYMGEKRFFQYRGVTNNCQVFVASIIKANNMHSDLDWILQDVRKSFSKASTRVINTTTDLANRVHHFVFGKGVLEDNIHPLTNLELNEYYAEFPFYLGTFMKDQLPEQISVNKALIMNLASSQDKRGSHWAAVVNNNGKVSYFDSYGLPPPLACERMMKASSEDTYFNNNQLQMVNAVTCGYFCIYYIDNILAKHRSEYDTLYTLTQHPSAHNEAKVTQRT